MSYEYRTLPTDIVVAQAPGPIVYIPQARVMIESPGQTPAYVEDPAYNDIPKTCTRCSKLYTRAEDLNGDACLVHSGYFRDGLAASWTCCKLPLQSAPGCVRVPHVESKHVTAELRRFLDMNALATQAATNLGHTTTASMPMDPFPKKQRVIRAQVQPVDGFVTHTVMATDTFQGVCLRYDISENELAVHNTGLSALTFPSFREIRIPIGADDEVTVKAAMTDEEKRKAIEEQLKIRFMRQFKVSTEIAGAYLGTSEYDYDEAAEDYLADLEFERKHGASKGGPSSRSTKFSATSSPSSITRK